MTGLDVARLAHLMDGRAVALVHLVKLVDAAHAHVSKHERPTLQHELVREWVLADVSLARGSVCIRLNVTKTGGIYGARRA